MKKKGFTLIELLAVIVILAIVALIATPIALNVINNAKNKADLASAYGVVDAAKLQYVEKRFKDEPIPSGNILNDLVIGGEKPLVGEVFINESGEIGIALKYGDKCYTKSFSDEIITVINYEDETCKSDDIQIVHNPSKIMAVPLVQTQSSYFLNGPLRRSQIKSITIADAINVPSGNTSWDVSDEQDGSVMAWYDASGVTPYDVYIGSDGGVLANESSKYLFSELRSLTSINLTNFFTDDATDMSNMFYNSSELTNLDLSSFNTSKVTDMSNMFYYTIGLTSLNISNFDTSNVTNMSYMFYNVNKVTNLDVSEFVTSDVTNMSYMFYNVNKVTNLDVSNFDTSNVTNMSYMFTAMSSLTNLDVSNFNTSKVTNMAYMFGLGITFAEHYGDWTLVTFNSSIVSGRGLKVTNLDLSSFDTTNVTNMKAMFYHMRGISNIDISNFNTSNVTSMAHMFGDMDEQFSIDMSGFNTSKVTDLGEIFDYHMFA